MIPKSRVVAVAAIAAMNFSSPLNAGTGDYLFEAVKPEIKSSNVAVIAVRLLRKPSRKPVTDAAVVQTTRLDMAPDGMAEMNCARRSAAEPGSWYLRIQGTPHNGGSLVADQPPPRCRGAGNSIRQAHL